MEESQVLGTCSQRLPPPPLHTHTLSLLQVVLALGDYMSVQCHACIGGTNVGEDIRKLDYGQHIVSGTPGRVYGKTPPQYPHD